MIFISTGTQFPFDRLIEIIDSLAPQVDEEIVVQALADKYQPRHITLLPLITRDQFDQYMRDSRIVISHAGMGTIITAMLMEKPIAIFPRKASLGEHRNEHQLATAKKFEQMGYVRLVTDASEIYDFITDPSPKSLHRVDSEASESLVAFVDSFIQQS